MGNGRKVVVALAVAGTADEALEGWRPVDAALDVVEMVDLDVPLEVEGMVVLALDVDLAVVGALWLASIVAGSGST